MLGDWMGGKRGPTCYEVPPESQKEPGSMASETLRVGEVGETKTKLRKRLESAQLVKTLFTLVHDNALLMKLRCSSHAALEVLACLHDSARTSAIH